MAPKISSRLIFAHVRASTEGCIAESNSHPFSYGNLLFMHNGNIGAWRYVKRLLADSVADHWYANVKGVTDSEWAFAVFLDALESQGISPINNLKAVWDQKILRGALKDTITRINKAVGEATTAHHLDAVETRSLLNFAVSDGVTVVATRYVSSIDEAAASLYLASGTAWTEGDTKGRFKMDRRDKGSDVVLIASEPVTFERHNWLSIPANTMITVSGQNVSIRPIKDQFSRTSDL